MLVQMLEPMTCFCDIYKHTIENVYFTLHVVSTNNRISHVDKTF